MDALIFADTMLFLSTLSLRRATRQNYECFKWIKFLSTLSLRRATAAEGADFGHKMNFYPRSPCGERRYSLRHSASRWHFYPRSPCGERHTIHIRTCQYIFNFYPRSPCGERHSCCLAVRIQVVFLSTLSLRRATVVKSYLLRVVVYFYPRSPCGERLEYYGVRYISSYISIHALLAESDISVLWMALNRLLFLSTLSLRRATCYSFRRSAPRRHFYPRSPCGERHKKP